MSSQVKDLVAIVEQGKSAKKKLNKLLRERAEDVFEEFLQTLESQDWGKFRSPCSYGMGDQQYESGDVSFVIGESKRDDAGELCSRKDPDIMYGCFSFQFKLTSSDMLSVSVQVHDRSCRFHPTPEQFFQAFANRSGRTITFTEHGSGAQGVHRVSGPFNIVPEQVTTSVNPKGV